jgi:hypothetical protein
MIATDHFVYVHLHKSGGTFVNEGLMRFAAGARQVGYHLPCRFIPAPLRGLPVLGFVRNPWSYYVSWFSFQSAMKRGNAVYRCLSEDGTLDFKATLRNMLDLGRGGAKLDTLLGMLPEAYGLTGINLPRPALAPIRDSGVGFYTYLYQYMFSGCGGKLFLGKTERLREDFLDFVAQYRIPASEELKRYLADSQPRNPSSHGPYTDYYDAESRDLVAERDAPLISSFGYTFGG